jgi:dTDP-4-dehydrorhamnose reductase
LSVSVNRAHPTKIGTRIRTKITSTKTGTKIETKIRSTKVGTKIETKIKVRETVMVNDQSPQSVAFLEEMLSRPSRRALQVLGELAGDILVLGVGGKMGPTLARMAKRASQYAGVERRVIGVSRFSDEAARRRLEGWGVETLSCDLLDEDAVESLPDAPHVIYMTGMKFGASQNPGLTWAMNCYVPALVCRRFRRSRIAVFSSGNVYPLVSVDSAGSTENDEPGPIGEYAITVLGRERIFQYFSQQLEIPIVLLRLNYATEMRYGILVDIAQDVLAGRPVEVSTPVFNVIWQADANAMTLAALAHAAVPPKIINIAGPEFLRVRDVAQRFGQLMNKPVQFTGQEGPTAYLNNGQQGHRLFGDVSMCADELIRWTAAWVTRGGETLGKPTHFQVRSGKF